MMGTRFEAGDACVGVVGVGMMGRGLAGSLLKAGYDVVCCDRRPEAVAALVDQGARAVELRELPDVCDVALVVVLDDKQVLAVAGDLLTGDRRLRALIVCSTILPSTVTELVRRADGSGVQIADATLSGGSEKSALGTLTLFVGADADLAEACAPIFAAVGSSVFLVGPPGAGSAAKLVNNLISMGGYLLNLEAMQLAAAYGISEDAVTDFVSVSAGDSRGLRTWRRLDRVRATHTLAGTPEVYELASKDIRWAAIAAGQRGVPLPIAATMGEMALSKLMARDRLLAEAPPPNVPLCPVCTHELALPFRARGTHPECGGYAWPPRSTKLDA
jgi:3-hydroxyisobutyrate dehydrogenase-like beta-hydroxyacid dehydrogenase